MNEYLPSRIEKMIFHEGNLREFFKKRKFELKREVESCVSDYILDVSEEDFCRYLVSKYSLVSPIIHEDKIYVYNLDRSRPSYVRGVQVTIAVPFEGDAELFQYKPSTSTYSSPRGKIVGQEIHLIYEMVEHDAEKLKQMYQQDLSKIERYLEWVRQDVMSFNNSLKAFVSQTVSQRKKKLLDDRDLVDSLGIPVKRRANLPRTYTIPSIQNIPKFEPPKVPKEPFKPEPVLALEEYKNILEILHNMSIAMERSPTVFSRLKEEEIRDFFLVMLNAHYEGQATGETFNYGGKTDILIRSEGKNVFIAECKFWHGQKKLTETIDQLLGYASWRDTKIAILLFNKNHDFSSVLEKIETTVKKHTCYKREWNLKSDKLKEETIFSYVFHQPQDVNREMIITIMTFDIPKVK
ncbi:hypothetical protein [Candidatus Pyrohabitans sp.]